MKKNVKTILMLVLLLIFMFAASKHLIAQAYNWTTLGAGSENGTNGVVYAIAVYNGRIVIGGSFSRAGNVPASNIAEWDENGWAPLGSGLNGTVRTLQVYNNSLYAGGSFTSVPGGGNVNRIARWNGSSWSTVGFPYQGVNNDVYALTIYNGNLVIAGKFTTAGNNTANRIVKWTGTSWVTLGSGTVNGVNDEVYALTVLPSVSGDLLIVGGKFTKATSGDTLKYIASWDEGNWAPLNTGMDERVYALTMHNSYLYAGGWFLNAGGVAARYIARWNGTNWSSLSKEVDDRVNALASYKGELIAAGDFKFADTLYANRIAKWDGTNWSRLITGMNSSVNALSVNDTDLYAGGSFTTAGGKVSRYVSCWGIRPTHSISGTIRFADNSQFISRGKVKAVRLDVSTREVIVLDTSGITSGLYTMSKVSIDTVFVVVFPSDELIEDNFVPTYHDSTIEWKNAVQVYPSSNLNNIDVYVFRAIPQGSDFAGSLSIGGHVYLNYIPPLTIGLPYKSDAIVYALQNGVYRGFSVSNTSELYSVDSLLPGTFNMIATRLGYTSEEKTVILGETSVDTIDFYLDTLNLIGIKKVNSEVPSSFALYQNYPNPFNPVTVIKFLIQKRSFVTMSIFNILGQEVMKPFAKDMEPGEYELVLNASGLPSGVYFYRLSATSGNDGFFKTRKMILIK